MTVVIVVVLTVVVVHTSYQTNVPAAAALLLLSLLLPITSYIYRSSTYTYRGRSRRRRFIRRQHSALSCPSVAGRVRCASRVRARGNCRAVNTMDRRRQWTLVVYPVITGFVRFAIYRYETSSSSSSLFIIIDTSPQHCCCRSYIYMYIGIPYTEYIPGIIIIIIVYTYIGIITYITLYEGY